MLLRERLVFAETGVLLWMLLFSTSRRILPCSLLGFSGVRIYVMAAWLSLRTLIWRARLLMLFPSSVFRLLRELNPL